MKPDHLVPTLVVALLAVLLVALVARCLAEYLPHGQGNAGDHRLVDPINSLEQRNADLQQQLDQENISMRSYEDQLALDRAQTSGTVIHSLSDTPGGHDRMGLSRGAGCPAEDGLRTRRPVRESAHRAGGLAAERSEEVKPGKGRVLVNTAPRKGTNLQDAAILAAVVVEKKTGRDLSESDVIVSIVAEDQVPAVDGGSAGALMTLLMISAIDQTQPQDDLSMTGTIDQDGHVGMIGGVV